MFGVSFKQKLNWSSYHFLSQEKPTNEGRASAPDRPGWYWSVIYFIIDFNDSIVVLWLRVVCGKGNKQCFSSVTDFAVQGRQSSLQAVKVSSNGERKKTKQNNVLHLEECTFLIRFIFLVHSCYRWHPSQHLCRCVVFLKRVLHWILWCWWFSLIASVPECTRTPDKKFQKRP